MNESRRKRGDTREDGMVFWCYRGGAEYWVTQEKAAEYRAQNAACRKNRYANCAEVRERHAKYMATKWRDDPDYRERNASRKRTEHYRAYEASYRRNRYAEDLLFASTQRMRSRTYKAFNRIGADKPASTEELLGTDWQTLKGHIEAQFVDGMSWENMSEWHIDHIVPLASAQTEEELAGLCHYTNLQPLWASDNLSKGAKLPHELN